jgi:hypothetical protein
MISTRGKRLRAARRTRFRSARAAALALGIPISTYGAHERAQLSGGRDFGPEEAKRYAQRFGVTPEWLLTGLRHAHIDTPFDLEQVEETAPPRTRLKTRVRIPVIAPVVGYVGAGVEAHFYDLSQGPIDIVERPRLVADPTNILEIRDHGLGPQFERWLVFFEEMRHPVTTDLLGYFCVVAMPDGQMVVRQLEKSQTGDGYDLLSEFGTNFRDVVISWAAKVTAMAPP